MTGGVLSLTPGPLLAGRAPAPPRVPGGRGSYCRTANHERPPCFFSWKVSGVVVSSHQWRGGGAQRTLAGKLHMEAPASFSRLRRLL